MTTSEVYKLLTFGVVSITFLFFVEAKGAGPDSSEDNLRPSSLNTLSLEGSLSYTPEQLKNPYREPNKG